MNPPGLVTAIVPGRLGSTRFPGKVLASETGRPMIQHVVDAASQARTVGRVVVACDDERIVRALEPYETETVLTDPDHPNGTSRLNEAAGVLGLMDDSIIVNVQGDEPDVDPSILDAAVEALTRSGESIATVASPFAPGEDPGDPNIVKVIARTSDDGVDRAVYFSRACIPHQRDDDDQGAVRPLKHVGLYVYRRGFLAEYASWPESPLERTERLEQLRVIERGRAIAVAIRPVMSHGVDTPEQYAEFVARWRSSHPGG